MQIIKQLYEIALRKRQPADLDYSLEAAVVLTMIVFLLRYYVFSLLGSITSPALYSALLGAGELIFTYVILRASRKQNRFIQTSTALYGLILLTLFTSIAIILIPIVQLAFPLLFIWLFYLLFTVLRSALECSTIAAILFTIGYTSVGNLLVTTVNPNFQDQLLVGLEEFTAALEQAKEQSQQQTN